MTSLLQSPFAIGVCATIAIAWVLVLVAIFRPGFGNTHADPGSEDDAGR